MTNTQLNTVTSFIAEKARELFGDKLDSVILYGSYARGDYDDESDIDIMIIADIPKNEIIDYIDKITDITSSLGLKYNIVVSVNIRDSFTFYKYVSAIPYYQNVLKEGVKVA